MDSQVTSFECPLESCRWTYEYPGPPPPDLAHLLPAPVSFTSAGQLAEAIVGSVETILRGHMESHPVEDWAREVMRLRGALAARSGEPS